MMSDKKMVKLNVEGINAEIEEDLIQDMMAIHGVDVLKEMTELLQKEAAIEKERANGLD
jgi:hypothetical protein